MSLAPLTASPARRARRGGLLAAAVTASAVALFMMGAGDAAQAAPAHLEQSVVATSILGGTFQHDVTSGRITVDQLADVAQEGITVGGTHIAPWVAKGESRAQVTAEIRAELQDSGRTSGAAVERTAIAQTLASSDARTVTKAQVQQKGQVGGITESKWFWSNHQWHISGGVIKTLITVGVAAYIGTLCITLDLSKLSCLALGVVVAGLGEFLKSTSCGQGLYFDFPKVWKSHCGG